MAENFEQDDDLARVIAWLKNNGLSLAVGAVLGLAIIVGWRWWNAYIDNRAHAAARLYGSVIEQIEQGRITDGVRSTVAQLKNEYTGSPYAANAALRLAAHAVSRQQYDKALAQLTWIIRNSDSVPTVHLARVRKARVLWAAGRADAALQLLETKHPDSFDRLYAELTGDIHAALGHRGEAHAAYRHALAGLAPNAGAPVLRRKLSQTAPADAQSTAVSVVSGQTADEGA